MILIWWFTIFLAFGPFVMCDDQGNGDELETCSLFGSVNKLLNITATITDEIDATQFRENAPLKTEYDFIIIGSSPAGCVLANRLSGENYSVLLLEAGSAENPLITNIPMNAPNLQLSDWNWNYATEVQENACLCMLCFLITNKNSKRQ